jgi:hypothetical protein
MASKKATTKRKTQIAPQKHDLFKFMAEVRGQIASEYARISTRSSEDPGTAGDQAEENWASVLRDWLPSNYHVVTKGRILGPDGQTSPQIDVLVLTPSYPKRLLNQKHYFAGGVIAAFECKLNLRSRDWSKVFANAVRVKRILTPTLGTPFDELHQPPFFGLLAHTARGDATRADEESFSSFGRIHRYETEFVEHPREMVDLVCIADEGTYVLNKSVHVRRHMDEDARERMRQSGLEEAVTTMYLGSSEGIRGFDTTGQIFGSLMHALTRYMAYRDTTVRSFSDYLLLSGTWGGIGVPVLWNLAVLSRSVVARLRREGYGRSAWSPWSEYWDFL